MTINYNLVLYYPFLIITIGIIKVFGAYLYKKGSKNKKTTVVENIDEKIELVSNNGIITIIGYLNY